MESGSANLGAVATWSQGRISGPFIEATPEFFHIGNTLVAVATDGDGRRQMFRRDKSLRLEESRIVAATRRYVNYEMFQQKQGYADNIAEPNAFNMARRVYRQRW